MSFSRDMVCSDQRLCFALLRKIFDLCRIEGSEVGIRDPGTEKSSLATVASEAIARPHGEHSQSSMKGEERDLQFIRLQEHDRVCPLMSLFPSICVVCPIGSVLLLRRHRARCEERLR